jgi:signal peptidase II
MENTINTGNKTGLKQYLLPFSLALAVVALDQLTKALVVSFVKIGERIEVLGDFFWIWHVRNTALAFNLGQSIPPEFRGIIILILQLFGVLALSYAFFKLKDITRFQRWCLAVAVGGGLGNLLDRLFRPEGVVDFLSVKFYGLFGFERWPTFNVADSVLVVTLIILFISLFLSESKRNKTKQVEKGKNE